MGVYAAIPMSRKWIYLGWIYAAFPIGWTVSHLLLAAIYYLIVTPIALAVRLAGLIRCRGRSTRLLPRIGHGASQVMLPDISSNRSPLAREGMHL